jgi:hypothetical protein
MENKRIHHLNLLALYLFSLLILVISGLAYFAPDLLTLLSTTSYYNLFRVNLGMIGIIIALTNNNTLIRYFNFFLGLIYIYQIVASMLHLFPHEYFRWSTTDTIINTDIGLSLLLISMWGMLRKKIL